MSRVYDRLETATLLLARAGVIKDRLDSAWRQCLANIEIDDLPRELRPQFLALLGIGGGCFAIALLRFRKTITQMA